MKVWVVSTRLDSEQYVTAHFTEKGAYLTAIQDAVEYLGIDAEYFADIEDEKDNVESKNGFRLNSGTNLGGEAEVCSNEDVAETTDVVMMSLALITVLPAHRRSRRFPARHWSWQWIRAGRAPDQSVPGSRPPFPE